MKKIITALFILCFTFLCSVNSFSLENNMSSEFPANYVYTNCPSEYILVSIDDQHLWYFKDNSLFLESPVTTGKENHETNIGVHKIINKVKDTYLNGPGYSCHVNYWMKINEDQEGIHDASWRTEFGTSDYLKNGSHGCINTPNDAVKIIYENVSIGTPVYVVQSLPKSNITY